MFDGRKKPPALFDKDKVKALETTLFGAWKARDAKGIQTALESFEGDLAKEPKELDGLLNTHANREKVYGWLFDTDHTRLEYSLRYEGTDLQVLSPGTRGIVLLVLYLSMDTEDNRPLIIDQPEGNLDNASVYQSLVPFLRTAKKGRQIILVTHNPNLVVTTDADQVIVARAKRAEDMKHPKITYVAGSLENAGTTEAIREQAVKLLEGGQEPFQKRGNRYDLS
jgi:ATPase subunit of ABC transporter with duplicated ATPase domains